MQAIEKSPTFCYALSHNAFTKFSCWLRRWKKNRQMAASCQETEKQAMLWKSGNVGEPKFQGRQDCMTSIQERKELLRSESNPLLFSSLITFIEFLRCLEKKTKELKEYLKINIVTVNLVMKRRQKWQVFDQQRRSRQTQAVSWDLWELIQGTAVARGTQIFPRVAPHHQIFSIPD